MHIDVCKCQSCMSVGNNETGVEADAGADENMCEINIMKTPMYRK